MNALLVIHTEKGGLRKPAIGWSYDDFIRGGNTLTEAASRLKIHRNRVQVGCISTHAYCMSDYTYPTVLHAILDGWTLLGPPTDHEENLVIDTEEGTTQICNKFTEWWLTK